MGTINHLSRFVYIRPGLLLTSTTVAEVMRPSASVILCLFAGWIKNEWSQILWYMEWLLLFLLPLDNQQTPFALGYRPDDQVVQRQWTTAGDS